MDIFGGKQMNKTVAKRISRAKWIALVGGILLILGAFNIPLLFYRFNTAAVFTVFGNIILGFWIIFFSIEKGAGKK